MRFARLVPVCLLAMVAMACSTTAAVTATSNFDRPVDVDFLCFDVEFNPATYIPGVSQSPLLPLTPLNCQLSDADNGPEGNQSTGNTNNHLLSVVTQFDRGELAVVDLANLSGVSLIDNVPSVPGVTFIPVGRMPTAVVADTWTPTLLPGTTTPPRIPMI